MVSVHTSRIQPTALTHDVERKANEPVVCRQRQKHLVDQQNMLEIVDDAFSVEKIHGRREKVPVQRLGEAEILLLTGNIGDGNDFLERDDLNRSHNDNNVDVSGEHGDEKERDHDESPYCPRNEGLFLLLVFGLGGFLPVPRKGTS